MCRSAIAKNHSPSYQRSWWNHKKWFLGLPPAQSPFMTSKSKSVFPASVPINEVQLFHVASGCVNPLEERSQLSHKKFFSSFTAGSTFRSDKSMLWGRKKENRQPQKKRPTFLREAWDPNNGQATRVLKPKHTVYENCMGQETANRTTWKTQHMCCWTKVMRTLEGNPGSIHPDSMKRNCQKDLERCS